MTTADRIAKFAKRAPSITSQRHLDRIMASFAPEHRSIAIERVSGILPSKLVAREDVEMPEVKAHDESNPTLQEATAARLNAQAAKILEQADLLAEYDKQMRSLVVQVDSLTKELQDEKEKHKGK